MKITKNIILSAASLALLGAAQAHAFGGGIAVGMSRMDGEAELDVSFSATATLETDEFNVEEQMYYRPGKLREEMQMAGQDMVTIQRHDLGKMWMVMPQGMYMEMAIDEPNEQMKSFDLVEHEQVGTEVINGMQTTKYKTIWETDDGRFGGFSWVTDDGIAVKAFLVSESQGEKHRIRFQINELQRHAQPNELFEVPEGYAKMDLSSGRGMGALLGGGRQMGQQRGQPPQQPPRESEGETPGVVEAASESAAERGKEETRSQVGKKVREGIRGLFRRD